MANHNDDIIEVIYKEIEKSMEDIPRLYYNDEFNLMTEVVNIFGGDINFDNVKLKIESLNNMDEKLDQVIKLIVKQHSDEFFKILGFVRQMRTETENANLKINDARSILQNVKSDISSLNQESHRSDWKFKSIFYSELITRLNRTYRMFKVINECETFLESGKIFECIVILKNNEENHHTYDVNFRDFNVIVNINSRFKQIDTIITEKLSNSLQQILLFNQSKILEKKLNSLNIYFLSVYSKISIDNELVKPFGKMLFLVKEIVNKEVENIDCKPLLKEDEKKVNDFDLTDFDIDSDKKLSSLVYVIKCLINFTKSKDVFRLMATSFYDKIFKLIESIMKISGDQLKVTDYSIYNLSNKSEKMIFLLFIQNILIIFTHTIIKLKALSSYFKDGTQTVNDIITIIEGIIILPLNVYFKLAGPRMEEKEHELIQGENIIRMKINENLYVTKEFIPILFKIYHCFYEFFDIHVGIKFSSIKDNLKKFNSLIFKDVHTQMLEKHFFDDKLFLKDFDLELNNFKFISDFITKINTLKSFTVFAFDESSSLIMKIFKDLFHKYNDDLKTFIIEKKSKCSYKFKFDGIVEELFKLQILKEIQQTLEFKKYTSDSQNIKLQSTDNILFLNQIMKFVFDIAKVQGDYNELYIKDYKVMELFTRLISANEMLIGVGETFIFELMKTTYSKAKMRAYLEQANDTDLSKYMSLETNDIGILNIINLKLLDSLTRENVIILTILKLEFFSLIANLIRSLNKSDYWLTDPQMTNEQFTVAFINEFNTFQSLFRFSLNSQQFEFLIKDYAYIINNIFIACVHDKSINTFGVNLLVRNFEYILIKIGQELKEIRNTIYYYPNYIKTLTLSDDQLINQLRKYYEIKSFSEEYIKPLFSVKTSSRSSYNDVRVKVVLNEVFK